MFGFNFRQGHRVSSKYERTISAKQIGDANDTPDIIYERVHETIDESALNLILTMTNIDLPMCDGH